MQIRQRLLLITGFMVLIASVTVAVIYNHVYEEIINENAKSGMEGIIDKKISILAELDANAQKDLILAANNPLFKEYFSEYIDIAEREDLKSEIENWMLLFSRRYGIDKISVIGNAELNGGKAHEIMRISFKRITEGSGPEAIWIFFRTIAPEAELAKDVHKSSFYMPTLQKNRNEIYAQEPYFSTGSKMWVFGYSTPIVLENGVTPAILHFEIKLKQIQDLMLRDFKDKNSRLIIVDKEGRLIADSTEVIPQKMDREGFFSPEGSAYVGITSEPTYYFPSAVATIPSKEFEHIVEKIKEDETGFDSFTQEGATYFIAYKPLSFYGWNIAIISPKGAPIIASPELLMKINEIRKQSVIYLFILVIMVILFAVIFSNSISNPIKQLVQGTKRIGSGDLDYRLEMKREDELGYLGTALNEMADNLKKRNKEQERLQLQIMQSDKLASIGLLAAGIAHEINTPITIIANNAQLAMKKAKDDIVIHKLRIIKEQVRSVADIVNGLLEFARQKEPKISTVDINQEISKTLKMLRQEFVNIKVIKDLGSDLPKVLADADYLNQVFVNLITNAIQAMPQGGELTIVTKRKGRNIEVMISDIGSGIPKDDLHRVMDPFFTTKKVGEGTGLGLSICRGIIQQHNGAIEIDSEVGIGTTVTIKLPTGIKT